LPIVTRTSTFRVVPSILSPWGLAGGISALVSVLPGQIGLAEIVSDAERVLIQSAKMTS
jgi:hypothetical protein